jgi:hypothetical protein
MIPPIKWTQSAGGWINIPPCPSEGRGVNRWTFRAACKLFRSGWSENEVRSYLTDNTTREGYRAKAEIERALERGPELIKGARPTPYSRWPSIDTARRERVLRNGITVADLSPREELSARKVLPILFSGEPLIWAARSVCPEIADTLPLSRWLPIAGMQQFIVPSPMIGEAVPPNGKSKRCLTNTGPRRFLVIESDIGTADEQTGVIWHLARFAPLALAVHSAGRSVHGWFYTLGRSEDENRAFMEYAVSLGADPATFVKCQPVRMPGGHRPNKGHQEILFLNPTAIRGAQ